MGDRAGIGCLALIQACRARRAEPVGGTLVLREPSAGYGGRLADENASLRSENAFLGKRN